MNHFPTKTFDMDGCEHRRSDPDCCGSFGEICLWSDDISPPTECGGIMHYQAVYGGYYYECDKCGRIK